MTTLEIIDAVTKILGLFSIGIAGFSLLQTSRYARKQWNLNAFTHYTEKFERIMSSFPENGYMYRLDSTKSIRSNDEVRLAVLRYLNLTSEEYYLRKDGYISDEVWNIWEPEIIRTLQTPLLIQEWQNLKNEFMSYPRFQEFVDKTQAATNLFTMRRS